jgi:imidazole glycerol-phosphate synthase subunit HisH
MTVVIVDTGIANRHSVRNALEYLGCDVKISADPTDIRNAAKLVFPGVGAFQAGIQSLYARDLAGVLTTEVIERGKPILGICLGYQMMAETGEEDGLHDGLSWVPGRVRRLAPTNSGLKIPHVGFNSVSYRTDSRLFAGMPPAPDFYFVHSYHLATSEEIVVGTADHGGSFTAAIERGNIMGVQFHPEKSQSAGLHLLRNFLAVE